MEITAKVIMERLNRIESAIEGEAEEENRARLFREQEIRHEMRIEHARRLLELGVDAEIIGKVTDLRMDFAEQLREAMK